MSKHVSVLINVRFHGSYIAKRRKRARNELPVFGAATNNYTLWSAVGRVAVARLVQALCGGGGYGGKVGLGGCVEVEG